jgi:hypothetical protein
VARDKDSKLITKTWREYEDGKNYNLQLNIYQDTDRNERFYAGDQWNGLNAPGMPTPVFNIFKRVINYFIAAILQQPVKLRFFPMLSNEESEDKDMVEMNEAAELISSYADTLMERLKMDTKNRQLLLDAALSGDMATYSFWNNSIKTGQESEGDIDMELVDGVNIYYGNPNQQDVEKQPYIVLAFRELVSNLQKEAKASGVPKKDYDKISSDLDNLYTAGDRGKVELNNNGGGKVETGKTTALLRLWKEDGKVMASKSTKFCPVRGEWDTKLTKYPVAMNNWDKRKNSYHGQALGTGIVPNQIYINQQFALIMIFMRDMGFPKVLFDKALIGAWSNKVGGSFGVNPGPGGLSQAAQYMTPATMNTQMFTSIDNAISYTKEFLGANDAALGDVNPDNARALAIVTEQAAVPLANIKANLYQLHEDMGYIMLDMMANFYGKRKVTVMERGKRVVKEFDFSKLKDIPMSLKVEVGPGTLYSELAGQATLDNLLETDKITFIQWLDRAIPGTVPKKQELMDEIKELEEAQAQQANGDVESREAFIANLSPEEAKQFRTMTPEQQDEILKGVQNEV